MSNTEKLATLSDRERAVLSLVAQGKSYKTISSELRIALSTVANHLGRVYKKLGVFRKEQALAFVRDAANPRDVTQECSVPKARLRDWRSRLERDKGTLQVMQELDQLLAA